jgi:hypothetical protein
MLAAEASMGAGAAATKAAKRVVKMIEARILMVWKEVEVEGLEKVEVMI